VDPALDEGTLLYNGTPVTPRGANEGPRMRSKADVHTYSHTSGSTLKHRPIIN